MYCVCDVEFVPLKPAVEAASQKFKQIVDRIVALSCDDWLLRSSTALVADQKKTSRNSSSDFENEVGYVLPNTFLEALLTFSLSLSLLERFTE